MIAGPPMEKVAHEQDDEREAKAPANTNSGNTALLERAGAMFHPPGSDPEDAPRGLDHYVHSALYAWDMIIAANGAADAMQARITSNKWHVAYKRLCDAITGLEPVPVVAECYGPFAAAEESSHGHPVTGTPLDAAGLARLEVKYAELLALRSKNEDLLAKYMAALQPDKLLRGCPTRLLDIVARVLPNMAPVQLDVEVHEEPQTMVALLERVIATPPMPREHRLGDRWLRMRGVRDIPPAEFADRLGAAISAHHHQQRILDAVGLVKDDIHTVGDVLRMREFSLRLYALHLAHWTEKKRYTVTAGDLAALIPAGLTIDLARQWLPRAYVGDDDCAICGLPLPTTECLDEGICHYCDTAAPEPPARPATPPLHLFAGDTQ